MVADVAAAVIAAALATELRFGGGAGLPPAYLILTCLFPLCWLASVALAGGYDTRVIGLGADEFRRVLNAGLGLAAALVIVF